MLAKLLCTKRKSASAPRCLRCLGATIDIVNSITRTANRSGQGVFSHRCLRKANTEDTVITGLGGLPGITVDATKGRRNADRDKCFLLLMFRHGLRVSEA